MDHHGTTALVTGASGGLGAEFARQLAARGSDVVLVARREGPLQEVAEQIRSTTGRRAHVVVADMEEAGVGDRLVAATRELGLRIDTVVNNAGLGVTETFADCEVADIQRQLRVDVDAVVDITRAFLPQLLASGRGALVNIGSLTGHAPMPGMAVYAASKAFVIRFTEALAYELRGSGLRVLAFSPGPTSTGFYQASGTSEHGVSFEEPPAVVRSCLAVLDRRRTPLSAVSSWRTRLSSIALTVAPRRVAARLLDASPARAGVGAGAR